MKIVNISQEIKELIPEASLGILQCGVKVEKSNKELIKILDYTLGVAAETLEGGNITDYPHIGATRKAYRALGKDPTKYRNSAEAMLRRTKQGKGLYHINNVVEVNNILSIASGFSLGTYDTSKIREEILLERAVEGSQYEGIGKELLNIEYLPALKDDSGYFGNPTSDSTRAMITESTEEIIMVIYSFEGEEGLEELLDKAIELLKVHCSGEDFQRAIIT
ncbi:B3/B4 domain-containing protein [Alloiococcus sp. CFN-8]|uniref:B3/B4 domain-containing protein n=1 Tax=Alloiococcus sp. CFN-8 TaxID=3416081 RepID=UPI003CF963F4